MNSDEIKRAIVNNGSPVNIIIGENGSGKSILLKELSFELLSKGSVIAVSTSIHDKFLNIKNEGYNYLGGKLGRNYASTVLKQAISDSAKKTNFKNIFKTLQYLKFDERVGIKIKIKRKLLKYVQHGQYHFFDDNGDLQDIEDDIMSKISSYFSESYFSRKGVIWLDVENSTYKQTKMNDIFDLLSDEKKLKKDGIISGVDIYLSRNNSSFKISQASSGELSLLALMVFCGVNVKDNTYILIDEPENSLHPKWQSEYISNILNVIGYYEVKIIVATHSPIILSSTKMKERAIIFKSENHCFEHINSESLNAEDIYYDFFQLLTPQNRSLSNECVKLLNQYDSNKVTYEHVNNKINNYISHSKDNKQHSFLKGVMKLLEEIHKGKPLSNRDVHHG